ncbi:hypothetical protein N5P37_007235 [Trichoderma harzianum]|nr:hypothetical protein N5P37_007235 [Trichoderma harzianum]
MVTPPVRRVGLSYLDSPEPLLKSIKSRTETKTKTKTTTTTTTTEAAPKPKPESRTQTRRSQIKIPEPVPDEPVLDDIFAPPLASSDLEDEGTAEDADNLEAEQPIADSSDSDDAPPRGAISSTTFTSQSQKGGRQTRRSTLKEGSKLKEEPEESQSTAKKRKRPSDGSPEKSKPKKNALPKTDPTAEPLNMANHLLNAQGFTKQSKVKNTFGKKSLLAQVARLPKGLEEPSTPVKFKKPPEYGTNTPRQSWKFLVPDSVGADSPIKRTRRLNMVEPILYENEDEDPDEDDEEDDDTVTYSQPGSFTGGAERATKDKAKPKRKKANPLRSRKSTAVKGEPEEDAAPITSSPPPAKFVMPAQLSDFVPPGNGNGDDIGDGDLSDASSSGLSSLGSLFPDKEGDGGAQCPWCGATVDMKLLKDFSNGKRLNVRLQTKFCEEHRKKSAMATWESKAYPEVEWSTLESRFKKHQTHLLDIINGEESFYRTRLAAKIEQGQGRSMKKEENLNPGYYGPRGFNMMCDYLVKEYSDMLKKKAVHDKVIAGRGSAAFIQAVLVAELGVQLIMEDMLVSPEEARHILEESKPIGDLVHADNWL